MISLAQPKVLHDFLNSLKKKPIKALSQNFLIDQNIIHKLIDSAFLLKDDIVLEIGSGAGAITEALLSKGIKVIAIEKDAKLILGLKTRFADKNLLIVQEDVLDIQLDTLLPKDKKVKVISNLPFQITSPILAKLLPLYEKISSLTLIMQKDVADRILAKPHSKIYSSLSIFTHLYSNPEPLFNISPHCFFPKPGVVSSAIKLTLKKAPISNEKSFIEFMRKGFNQKRKMLSSSLPYPSEKIQKILSSLSLSPKSRPEELFLDDWINLFLMAENKN